MYEIRPHSDSSDVLDDGCRVEFMDSTPAPDCDTATIQTHPCLLERGDGERIPVMPTADGLALLTDKQRTVVRAKFEGGQTFDRIGRGIGVSWQAAHRIFHRALTRLAKTGSTMGEVTVGKVCWTLSAHAEHGGGCP